MRRQRTSIDLNDLHITIDEAARFSQLALFPGTLLDIIAPNGDFSRVNLNPVPSDFFFGLLSGVTVPLRTASVLRSELLLQRRTRASIDVSGAYAGYTEAIRNAMAGMDGLLKIYEYMPRFEDAHRERALQFMRTELTPASFGTMFSFLWSLVDNSLNGKFLRAQELCVLTTLEERSCLPCFCSWGLCFGHSFAQRARMDRLHKTSTC